MGSTIRPYDLYVRLLSGTPTAEVEPNNTTPNPLPPNGWVSGTIDVAADVDFFSLTANAGDTIIAILDADPERDAPEWNPTLAIGPFNNFVFVVNGSGVGGAFDDVNPSEAFMMTVPATGTYTVRVVEAANGGAPNFTYNLSVSVIPAKSRTCTNYAGVGGPVTDVGITDFTVAIPDTRTIDNLRLNFNATTAQTADLDVSLISPDGNEVFLFDDPPNQAGAGAPQFDFALDDEAGIPVSLFGVHAAMGYIPEAAGRMAYFKGMQAQGTWTLRVRDDLTANIATVNSWSLDVCEAIAPPFCVVPGPNETTVYTSDFEADDGGFTHAGTQDEWERGLPAFAPITSAHSGVNAWKTDLDNTYNASSNQDLLSPSLDLTSATGRITLNWWQKFQFETTTFDIYWVEVREVGLPATARKLFEWTGATMTRGLGNPSVTIQQSAGWGLMKADISDFAGRNVEVRFHVETDSSVQFAGVGVDDVSVTSCELISTQAISNAAVTVTDGQTTYFPGEPLTYTIVASNAGPHTMFGANVTADFPDDLTNVTWTCVASNGSDCGTTSGSGDIDEDVDILNAGNVTYTVQGTVAANTTGPLAVSGAITVPAGYTDPDTANNSATDTNQLIAAASHALVVDDAGNDVLELGETAIMAPAWRNTGDAAVALTGTLSNFDGPSPGPTYSIVDGDADYGTIAVGANASCTTTGDCYSLNISGTRPAATTHWDSTVDETIDPLGTVKTWTLHVGDSFTDVPRTSPFYPFIETILHGAVTGGCTGATYCPTQNTAREQIAVFVLVAKEGPGYTPPACTTPVFGDVPANSPFCPFIEELARRGVTSGCGGGNYCPTAPTSREQLAVIVLATLDPTINPPACVAGSEIFNDVPFDSPFCRWIEELFRRQVITGCGGGNYCPTNPVSREQMSVFLSVTFGLTLYGL
jgi:uncharacterized repeat protein (TIGR01451 family)